MKHVSPQQDQAIRDLMRRCGQEAAQKAIAGFEVFEKGANDYVTTIDHFLDQQLTAGFRALFPKDGLITEENVRSRQLFSQGYSRLWMVDPLDGTEDFIQGQADYALMAGLLQDAQPVAGWLYAPSYDRFYFGGRDWGLFQSVGMETPELFAPMEPESPSATFCPMIIGTKDKRRFGEAIQQQIPAVQFGCLGSFGLKVMEVVLGRAGIYVYFNGRVKLWDTVGPLSLALAAGLECCDLQGEPLRFTPDALDPDTLAHVQTIVIGWPRYVEALRPRLVKAVEMILETSGI